MGKAAGRKIALYLVAVFMLTMVFFSQKAYADVTKVSNVSSGIKVTWSQDASAEGYNIYRNNEKVAAITGNDTTSWTDTEAVNGTRYSYSVKSVVSGMEQDSSVAKKTVRLSRPVVKLSANVAKGFTATTGKNESATGYQMKYSKSSTFSSATTKSMTGKALSKKVTGLTSGKKYYVKARSYVTVDGVKYYSAWSAKKYLTVKSYYYAYVKTPELNMYKRTDSSLTPKTIKYDTKIQVYGTYKSSASGSWIKVKYSGVVYYVWQPKGTNKFKTEKSPSSYVGTRSNYQQEILDLSMDILKNWKTKYCNTVGKNYNYISDGKHCFDCSGFVSYVYRTVYNKENYVYRLEHSLQDMYKTDIMYNNGIKGEYKSVTVCKGTIDYSKLEPGDIIFFKEDPKSSNPVTHCGIYLGNKEFVHSSRGADGVNKAPLTGMYVDNFVSAIRPMPDTMTPANIKGTITASTGLYPDMLCNDGKIMQLSKGTTVTVKYVNTDRGRAHVAVDGKEGVVNTKYLKMK